MATAKPTPSPRWLLRWALVAVVVAVVVAALAGLSSQVKPYLPGGGSRDGEKHAAMELCWQEQGTTKPGTRIEGGACDALDRLFLPKINDEAYGIYNPNAANRTR